MTSRNKHKPIWVYDKVTRNNFYISYGIAPSDYIEAVKRLINVDVNGLEYHAGKCQVFTYYPEGDGQSTIIWIWTREKKPHWLMHEIFHAVHFALRSKCILSDDSDEMYAYFLEMLVYEILEKLKKERNKKTQSRIKSSHKTGNLTRSQARKAVKAVEK